MTGNPIRFGLQMIAIIDLPIDCRHDVTCLIEW